jgi:hypothetical protein
MLSEVKIMMWIAKSRYGNYAVVTNVWEPQNMLRSAKVERKLG